MDRRLAAILAADVVGYSTMMEADQEGTLAALRLLRSEVFGPAIVGNRGEVVKSMGDGWLVEFASAIDAVTCAMQLQDRLAVHETIRLRIGIHVGDVVHDEDDVFGAGVNVAARLEALAEPGAVLVSDAVYGSLDGTLRPSFADRGAQRLKNIDREVRAWSRGGEAGARAKGRVSEAVRSGYPRLVLQPTQSSDQRAEIRELCDAITFDLGQYLEAFRWLVTETGETPAVGGYSLQPVLRARGDRLRLDVRLFAPGRGVAWSGTYDGDLADSFSWQDDTVERIASDAPGVILEAEKHRYAKTQIAEMSAEECALVGVMEIALLDREGLRRSLTHFAAAIDKGTDSTEIYALAIMTAMAAQVTGQRDIVQEFAATFDNWTRQAEPIAAKDPLLELAFANLARLRTGDEPWLRRASRNALRLAPREIESLLFTGWGHIWIGEPEEALDCLQRCVRLARSHPWLAVAFAGIALAELMRGRDDAALAAAQRGFDITSEYNALWRTQASALAHLGRLDEASSALKEALRLVPWDSIAYGQQRSNYADTPGTRRFHEGLRLAGMPEGDDQPVETAKL